MLLTISYSHGVLSYEGGGAGKPSIKNGPSLIDINTLIDISTLVNINAINGQYFDLWLSLESPGLSVLCKFCCNIIALIGNL